MDELLLRGLWNVNFGKAIFKADVQRSTVDLLAVVGVKDVAKGGTIRIKQVWNVLVNIVVVVGQSDKHVTSLESVEVIEDILLLKGVLVALSLLSGLVDQSSRFVEVGGGVHVLPERLSVLRVVASGEVLLTSVVVEWDTLSS